jgi:hybrid cluster-associated redox disulfide protein
MNQSKKIKLTPKTNIIETVEHYPSAAKVFAERGIPCLGCAAAHFETLADIAEEFNVSVEKLINEIQAQEEKNEKLE